MTIIICVWNLNFPLIWIWFLLCICVCFCYIWVLETIGQAMVASYEDLQNGPKCMWVKYGIFSPFYFSPIDLTFLDSNVILISLGTFPNHCNHSKRSSSKICKNGHKHMYVIFQFFLFSSFIYLAFTWARLRVNLGWD
jgi:hypothetical protein